MLISFVHNSITIKKEIHLNPDNNIFKANISGHSTAIMTITSGSYYDNRTNKNSRQKTATTCIFFIANYFNTEILFASEL